jgi:hypothetical protein
MAVTEIEEVLVPKMQFGADDGLEVGIELLLGFEIFDNGFYDQCAIGQVSQLLDGDSGGPMPPRQRIRVNLPFSAILANWARIPATALGGSARPVASSSLTDMTGRRQPPGAMPAPMAPVPTTAIACECHSVPDLRGLR